MTTPAEKIIRTDLLSSNMTKSKEAKLRAYLKEFRKAAVVVSRPQWRLFFDTGSFNAMYKDGLGYKGPYCDVRRVVVGQLQSYVSNRANDFKDIVVRSNLDDITKHQLNLINRKQAWFLREPVLLKGEEIGNDVRLLARKIYKQTLRRNRRPNLSQVNQMVNLTKKNLKTWFDSPLTATQAGRVDYWIKMPTLQTGKPIWVPILGYDHHRNRIGERLRTIQFGTRDDGSLFFGIMTDVSEQYAGDRKAYDGEGEIGMDFGLSRMFATSEGDLLGSRWLSHLKKLDVQLRDLKRGLARRNIKYRQSKRYRALTARIRGFIKNEVNRVFNRLIKIQKPKSIVLERLNFQNSNLSRSLNRIISNCGRGVITTKLKEIEERFGVEVSEVNPAYTSQTCNGCGYVAKDNRNSDKFKCHWCGNKVHADVNAAQNIKQRRALPIGSVYATKADILDKVVDHFVERNEVEISQGGLVSARLIHVKGNKYFDIEGRLHRSKPNKTQRKSTSKLAVS